MNKKLIKLIAISSAAVTLANVGATASAYVDLSGYDWGALTNVKNAQDRIRLLREIAQRISIEEAKQHEILANGGLIAIIEQAKKDAADAQKDVDAAQKAFDEAVAKDEAAKKAVTEATDKKNKAHNKVTRAINEVSDLGDKIMQKSRDQKVANQEEYSAALLTVGDDSAEQEALAVANEAVVHAREMERVAPNAEEKASAQAVLNQAIEEAAKAQTALNKKQSEITQKTAAITKKYTDADAKATQTEREELRALAAQYGYTGVYGKDAIIEALNKELVDAQAEETAARTAQAATAAERATKRADLNAKKLANAHAQGDLRTAQSNLAASQAEVLMLQEALGQLMGEKHIGDLEGAENLTKEEKELLEKNKIDTKELDAKAKKLAAEREALEKAKKEIEEELDRLNKESEKESKSSESGSESDENENSDHNDGSTPGNNDQGQGGSESGSQQQSSHADNNNSMRNQQQQAKEAKKDKLPETGEASNAVAYGAAALAVVAGIALVAPKFKKEN